MHASALMWNRLWRDVSAIGPFPTAHPNDVTTELELTELPPAARAYMSFHGIAASQPKRWSLRLGWKGRFRLGPKRRWMPIEAVQYNTRSPVSRTFHMKGKLGRIVPVLARDTYAEGHGHLLARVADLVTVAKGRGPEYDQGELVTWVNDCAFFAPSMLLGPSARWSHVDDRTFDLTFTDRGCTVSARLFVDTRGALVDFETIDRFLEDPDDPEHPLVRARWTTPITSWRQVRGKLLPGSARATWHLPSGEFTYADFALDPTVFALDVEPWSLRDGFGRARESVPVGPPA